MKKYNMAFGRALRSLRKMRQLTQENLAFESALDRTYISLLERGERSPTLDTQMALCHALNVSLTTLAINIEKEVCHE